MGGGRFDDGGIGVTTLQAVVQTTSSASAVRVAKDMRMASLTHASIGSWGPSDPEGVQGSAGQNAADALEQTPGTTPTIRGRGLM